jgi:hypothetical protein
MSCLVFFSVFQPSKSQITLKNFVLWRHIFVPKIHKIEHTVEGIFDVVSSIILNTDHSLRVLKIFDFSSVGIVLLPCLIKTLLIE